VRTIWADAGPPIHLSSECFLHVDSGPLPRKSCARISHPRSHSSRSALLSAHLAAVHPKQHESQTLFGGEAKTARVMYRPCRSSPQNCQVQLGLVPFRHELIWIRVLSMSQFKLTKNLSLFFFSFG
jgi:hypothetical protein